MQTQNFDTFEKLCKSSGNIGKVTTSLLQILAHIPVRDISETDNMAHCAIPYKWLLVYQDHFTKYIILRNTSQLQKMYWKRFSVTSVLRTSSSQAMEAIFPTRPVMTIYQNNSRKASTSRESRHCRTSKQRGKKMHQLRR